MKLNDAIKIAVLPGDGIGVEVMEAALPVFESLGIPVILNIGDIGWSFWTNEGTALPERTRKLIAESDTVLLGAITSKPEREAAAELAAEFQLNNFKYVSPVIQLRQHLDLFANVRPCFNIKGEGPDFNFCVIRENTEGLYAGFDYHPIPDLIHDLLANNPRWQSLNPDDLSCALRLQSKSGLQRLFAFAFEYAYENGLSRVTLADKPNVLRSSGGFARELFELAAQRYPNITADILNVDAVALWLIRRPEEFGVIVAENMFGDILSDVGAGVMGGLGFAASANIGQKGCYFEPVHGSGPRLKPNSANPSAMFLTIALLLDHFGYQDEAKTITAAVTAVTRERRIVTRDLGGYSSCKEMAVAIISQCHAAANEGQSAVVCMMSEPVEDNTSDGDYLPRLHALSTTHVSDALDACGVAGALSSIKAVSPGHQLIGPAFTVSYLPYETPPITFRNAHDYIDTVPAGSVILIDNNGQTDCSVWGELLTHVAVTKGIAGTVIHGAARDVQSITYSKYPLFCAGLTMRTGKNRVYKSREQCPLMIDGITINPGDIIFGDDNGVLVIPLYLLDEVITKAQNIQRTEEKIRQAVSAGSTLKQARIDYHYDRPWLP